MKILPQKKTKDVEEEKENEEEDLKLSCCGCHQFGFLPVPIVFKVRTKDGVEREGTAAKIVGKYSTEVMVKNCNINQ